jgi:hypothetical protein
MTDVQVEAEISERRPAPEYVGHRMFCRRLGTYCLKIDLCFRCRDLCDINDLRYSLNDKRYSINFDADGNYRERCAMHQATINLLSANNQYAPKLLSFKKWPDFFHFKNLLEDFLVRQLTYPCDSVDAFSGILRTLEPSFPGGFHFGLPELFLALPCFGRPIPGWLTASMTQSDRERLSLIYHLGLGLDG